MFISSYILIFVLAYIPTAICYGNVDYQSNHSMGVSCFPQDSCKFGDAVTCKCDEHCALYGDCCSDSNYPNNQRHKSAFSCQEQRKYSFKGIYVKSICPRHNVDLWVRQNCEVNPSSNDIELRVPVFSTRTLITYRNYYCALCNNDQSDLLFWDVALDCNAEANKKEIMENLVYNDVEQKWGFWCFSNGRENWVTCTLSPQFLPKIQHYRECSSAMISECHSQWRNNNIRNMCNLYESRMFSKYGKIYKNVHCALCNNVNMKDLTCGDMKPDISFYGGPGGFLFLNFQELLDINLKKGNKIGKLNECPDGQVYDEAFLKCVKAFCVGNRVPRGGKCVVA